MPSRELRRLSQKKGEKSSADQIEKRRESHPLLYAFSVVLLVIIVVTFIGSPVARQAGAAGKIVFGSYGGREIAFYPGNYFAQQRDLLAEQVQRTGTNQDSQTLLIDVWRRAFEQTVLHTSVLLETERSGVHISESRIDEALLSYPRYMLDGKFNEEKYNLVSVSEKMATRKLIREQLLSEQYFTDISASEHLSTNEAEFVDRMAQTEKSFSFVSFKYADYPLEEIAKYAKQKPEKFKKMKLSRILIKSSESNAKEIRKKLLEKTSSFEELAKSYSKDSFSDKGGDMGWTFFYDLEGDFEKKETLTGIFSLKQGDISEVIKSKFGWVIIRVDSQALEPDLSDPDTLTSVKDYLMRYERGKVEDYFMEIAGKFERLALEKGFAEAAKELNFKTSTTDFLPMNYQGIFALKPIKVAGDENVLNSALYSEEFFQKAFSLIKDQVSSPVLLDDQIVVLKMTGEQKAPDTEKALLESYFRYLANQSLQIDLQAELINQEKLKDNFDSVMSQYIVPK